MDLQKLNIGVDVPDEILAVIEIPAGVSPVKYEVDKESGTLVVDRFVATAMHYPCNYGFVPNTLADDGDPLDVLVVTPYDVVAGSVIKVRPIGVLNMEDESGIDFKVICVPVDKLTKYYSDVKTYDDLPKVLINQISHFFEHYKDLEEGKWVKITGFEGVEKAKSEIKKSVLNYKG